MRWLPMRWLSMRLERLLGLRRLWRLLCVLGPLWLVLDKNLSGRTPDADHKAGSCLSGHRLLVESPVRQFANGCASGKASP
jgi:hypothetical protein